jgi:aryl-alcohol dehydrogenase-like predicted oxidoreductase
LNPSISRPTGYGIDGQDNYQEEKCMQKRKLGNTDMEITPVGLGTWAMGGPGEWGWGPQDDQASIDTIHHAIDCGINWLDTAPAYGRGRSEQVIGRALHNIAEKPLVFTKCSLVWDEHGTVTNNLSPASIRREVEDSLRRLQIDVIDLYQIHWPIPDEGIEDGWQTLVDLKHEGKVRHIAVSNFDVHQMKRAMQIAPVSSNQLPYSAVRPEIREEILPFCEANNIGVIVYSPLQAGLLSGKMSKERIVNLPDSDWRARDDQFNEPRLSRNLALQDLMREIAYDHGRNVPEVAIAWVLAHSAVTGAIVGARRPNQVDGFMGAGEFRLDPADLQRINTFIGDNQ